METSMLITLTLCTFVFGIHARDDGEISTTTYPRAGKKNGNPDSDPRFGAVVSPDKNAQGTLQFYSRGQQKQVDYHGTSNTSLLKDNSTFNYGQLNVSQHLEKHHKGSGGLFGKELSLSIVFITEI